MSEADVESDFKYTKEHEWIQLEDNIATIGITDHAQKALGDLVFVELPTIGDDVSKGDTPIVVESYKAASDVYAPLSGEIVEINESLTESPEQVNQSPYEDGWLIKIKISDKSELDELMDADGYKEYLSELDED